MILFNITVLGSHANEIFLYVNILSPAHGIHGFFLTCDWSFLCLLNSFQSFGKYRLNFPIMNLILFTSVKIKLHLVDWICTIYSRLKEAPFTLYKFITQLKLLLCIVIHDLTDRQKDRCVFNWLAFSKSFNFKEDLLDKTSSHWKQ